MSHPPSNCLIAIAVQKNQGKIAYYNDLIAEERNLASVTFLEHKPTTSDNFVHQFDFPKHYLVSSIILKPECMLNIVDITIDKKYSIIDLFIIGQIYKPIIKDNLIHLDIFFQTSNNNVVVTTNRKDYDMTLWTKFHALPNKVEYTINKKFKNLSQIYHSCETKKKHDIYLSKFSEIKELTDIIITQKVYNTEEYIGSFQIYVEEAQILNMTGKMTHEIVPKLQLVKGSMIDQYDDYYLKHYLISFGEYTSYIKQSQNSLNLEELTTTSLIINDAVGEIWVTCLY